LVHGLRISREDWKHLCTVFLAHGTIREVATHGRRSYATAQKVVHIIRAVMTSDVPLSFAGICEADETYIGGAWKNKAIHIRRQGSLKGRGTLKQAVFGVACRDQKQVRVWLVPNCKSKTLFAHIRAVVTPGSSIFTDGLELYRRLPEHGYHHASVNHDAGEYVRGNVHTQTIDGFWGLLKTHLDSIGGIRKRFASLFVGEVVWRYNFRHLTRSEQVNRLIELLARISGRRYT